MEKIFNVEEERRMAEEITRRERNLRGEEEAERLRYHRKEGSLRNELVQRERNSFKHRSEEDDQRRRLECVRQHHLEVDVLRRLIDESKQSRLREEEDRRRVSECEIRTAREMEIRSLQNDLDLVRGQEQHTKRQLVMGEHRRRGDAQKRRKEVVEQRSSPKKNQRACELPPLTGCPNIIQEPHQPTALGFGTSTPRRNPNFYKDRSKFLHSTFSDAGARRVMFPDVHV